MKWVVKTPAEPTNELIYEKVHVSTLKIRKALTLMEVQSISLKISY